MTAISDRLQVVQSDITKLDVDAIVNAANTSLLGGGGGGGALPPAPRPGRGAGGRMLNGCKTGQAKLTGGYGLPARWVIHTVGPVWQDGDHGEDELLESAYLNSLKIAGDKEMRSVAFPAISTGVYRFPLDRATRIAVRTVAGFLARNPYPERVIFCAFGGDAYREYLTAVQDIA